MTNVIIDEARVKPHLIMTLRDDIGDLIWLKLI